MLVYAASDDLADWVTDIPDNAPQLLRRASIEVATATRHDTYAVLPSGLPEPGGVAADAMRDAVCAQVASWQAAGIDPAAGAVQPRQVTASSIGGASLSYSTPDTAAAATGLCDSARKILRNAGMAGSGTTTWGGASGYEDFSWQR